MLSPEINEILTLVANVAIALTFLAGLVFGVAQVRAAARDRHERLTLETLRNFQTREFAELMFHVNNRELPKSGAELRALPDADQILFIQMAQQMESLGILVAEKLVDIDLVDKTLGSFVTSAWGKYSIPFQDMREKTPDPFLGEYFQWLSELITKRMENKPRQPFYLSGA